MKKKEIKTSEQFNQMEPAYFMRWLGNRSIPLDQIVFDPMPCTIEDIITPLPHSDPQEILP
jgi:hypothetical protein